MNTVIALLTISIVSVFVGLFFGILSSMIIVKERVWLPFIGWLNSLSPIIFWLVFWDFSQFTYLGWETWLGQLIAAALVILAMAFGPLTAHIISKTTLNQITKRRISIL